MLQSVLLFAGGPQGKGGGGFEFLFLGGMILVFWLFMIRPQAKKAKDAKKKQKVVEIKEIKLRPGIDTNDYNIKLRNVLRFLEEGDKVKITLRFRGREMSHMEIGMEVINRMKADTAAHSRVESEPKTEGRQMVMVLAPAKH